MENNRRDHGSTRTAKTGLSSHYNASQLRLDTWNNLKYAMRRYEAASQRGKNTSRLQAEIISYFEILEPIENYFAFPGKHILRQLKEQFNHQERYTVSETLSNVVRMLVSDAYRDRIGAAQAGISLRDALTAVPSAEVERSSRRHYFEVLVVDNLPLEEEQQLRQRMLEMASSHEHFVYDVVVVNSFEDALIAVMFNANLQSCVVRYNFPYKSSNSLEMLQQYVPGIEDAELESGAEAELGATLGIAIKDIRPELDLFLVTDSRVEEIARRAYQNFRRVFYRQEDYLELHLSLIKGILERYDTPFFFALREYSQRPTGVFHAMPISRGNSIFRSQWIQDMGRFYGRNIFLAETSATTGGLDSLLQPTGPLKKAQRLAARTFGARHTFFVTNGTSTSNKIVVQALVQPGDIVLVDRDCHKSHHYGLVLSGAQPVYLESYPIQSYSMYGAVPLREIKHKLLQLKRAGRLHKVKMLLLTNCTFDGLIYNVERVMQEVLAIKPDMIFLWDEAWFGFAYFSPNYRQRTAMHAADKLYEHYRSDAYQRQYAAYRKRVAELDWEKESTWLENELLPDPDKVKIRVYATQSTHKKLSAMRQGAMIHIHDEDFKRKAEEMFHEAYMTHTSTSANYQLLASLDIARRQACFEGYELVQKSVESAMVLRSQITDHPLLQKYFSVLTLKDLIPAEFRPSGIEQYYDGDTGWSRTENAWSHDEFTLDPTHITLYIGETGIDGDTFKREYLMDQFGIQINKTTRNTVLFMTNIGTRRSSVAFLISVLLNIARQLDQKRAAFNSLERDMHEKKVISLTRDLPPLPDFSYFHPAFRPVTDTPEGDMRRAYFLAYNEELCEFLRMDGALQAAIDAGREVVSANFVIPYPPGFPILVPGQVLSQEILDFMQALDVKEIHGYRPELGLRVFKREALEMGQHDGKAVSKPQQRSEQRTTKKGKAVVSST